MTAAARPPVVLFDQGPPNGAHLGAGWRARDAFDLPASPWDLSTRRWICVGTIDDLDTAALAIEALTRGVGLAVAIGCQGDLRHRTLEDLHRLGDVQPATAAVEPLAGLDDAQRGLIEELARGATVTQAAQVLHLSRRTANRRLAEIREHLGVGSTAEVISCWVSARRHLPPSGEAAWADTEEVRRAGTSTSRSKPAPGEAAARRE